MKENTKGMLVMLLCPIIWSLSGLVAKSVPWPGLCIAGWRGILTALTMYVYMRVAGIRPVWNRRSFLLGVSGTTTILFYFAAMKMIPAANAVALQYTAPIFLMLYNALLRGMKYRRADYLVAAAALFGIALLFTAGGGAVNFWGSVLALISGACYGATYYLVEGQQDAVRLSGLMLGSLMAGVGIFTADIRTLPMGGNILPLVIGAGLFQISVPYILMTVALRMTTALACSLIATLEMVLNPLWVYIFVGEAPSLQSILGCAVIMAAVVLWCVDSSKNAARAQEA